MGDVSSGDRQWRVKGGRRSQWRRRVSTSSEVVDGEEGNMTMGVRDSLCCGR